jgi:hypothetical protein
MSWEINPDILGGREIMASKAYRTLDIEKRY